MSETEAAFYPHPLPDWVRANHRRGAECRVYDALRAQLESPWVVFYSRPWLGVDHRGHDKEGEADFVVVHPDLGMLVIEVKGGIISRDAGSGEWYSTDAQGFRHRIKDPAAQASRNKHGLLDVLSGDPRWHGRHINACHGVVFPDCLVPTGDLGTDLPRRMIAGIEEMDHLARWVKQRLAPDGLRSPAPAIGAAGVSILKDHFGRSFVLTRPASATLQYAENEIRLLTDEQARNFDIFGDEPRIAVPGPAGTGKTALAVEQGRRLARAGKRVLLLCFNRPLAANLRREVAGQDGLEVHSFHALCDDRAERAGISLPRTVDSRRLLDREYPQALVAASKAMPADRYDAIIVDEGQDFPASWLASIETLLKDEVRGTILVFHDDNQKVLRRQEPTLPSVFPRSGVRLRRILRNGRRLVSEIEPLLPRPFVSAGPEGEAVLWQEAASRLTAQDLAGLLGELCDRQKIRPSQIAILAANEAERERVRSDLQQEGYRTTDAEEAVHDCLVCDTVRRFKGLERPVVILVEPELYIGEPETLYVALTRPRLLLCLLASHGRLAQIRMLTAPPTSTLVTERA